MHFPTCCCSMVNSVLFLVHNAFVIKTLRTYVNLLRNFFLTNEISKTSKIKLVILFT